MSVVLYDTIADDPAISPDFGTPDVGLDVPLAPDPFATATVPADPSVYSAPVYGPSLAQLGLTPESAPALGDPSAFASHPSTSAPSGTSVWDEILGTAKIGLAAAQIATGATSSNIKSPATNANKIITAKHPGGAGSGLGILGIVIVIFVALFVWLELKH